MEESRERENVEGREEVKPSEKGEASDERATLWPKDPGHKVEALVEYAAYRSP